MICSLLVFLQLEFLQNKELGYNKKNVLIIPVEKQNIRQQYESFRTDLLAHSDIEQVTSTSDIPDSHMYEASGFKIEGSNNTYPLIHFGVNYDFFETLKMKLIAGRFYSRDFSDTAENRYIINKSAVHAFGWTNPAEAIGKKCNAVTNLPDLPGSGIIIGVVDDFHFKSLEMSIEPLVILLSPEENNHIFIRLNPNEVSETLYKIKEMWQNRFPDTEFQYSFLEERLNDQYSDEDSLKRKLFLSTFLAVFIACLGLFGLSVFVIQRREKEVGIRKVLGASEMTIIKLLCGDYLRLILISALLSWPLSYFLIMTWLQNFAERIAILNYWWVFVFAGLLAIVISLVTIGVQTLKYSRINPVESLKYE
jgi:putative ABC transport system permease protein